MNYDCAVVIMRGQPVHNGHKHLLTTAAAIAKRVIVLAGSAYSARTFKNPFPYSDVRCMILGVMNDIGAVCDVFPLHDHYYSDNDWIDEVDDIIKNNTREDERIVLVGCLKEHGCGYLNWLVYAKHFISMDNAQHIDGTTIRDFLFSENSLEFIRGVVPPATFELLSSFRKTKQYRRLLDEYQYARDFYTLWSTIPIKPTFITADAVVFWKDKVLLIERKSKYGNGLAALPGGFVNGDETIEQAMIRELMEETKIEVPFGVLRARTIGSKVFDAPQRSLVGRRVTTAFCIRLPDDIEVPKVTGSDDAAKAFWCSIDHLEEQFFFEDHYHIIKYFLGD